MLNIAFYDEADSLMNKMTIILAYDWVNDFLITNLLIAQCLKYDADFCFMRDTLENELIDVTLLVDKQSFNDKSLSNQPWKREITPILHKNIRWWISITFVR